MSRLRFELAAMALVVVLAALSVFATLGSARGSDLVFCRLLEGDVVVGVTTDCSAVVEIDPALSGDRVAGVGQPGATSFSE